MVQWIEKYPVVVSLVATLVVVVLTIWATRKWGGNRRIRLRVAWSCVRMVAASTNRDLEVRLDGKVVRAPFLVTLSMYNSGPKDVSDASFSRQKPMKVVVNGAEIVDVLDQSDEELPHILGDNKQEVLVGPGLLKIKVRRDLTLITEGRPDEVTWGGLADVDTDEVMMSALKQSRFSFWSEPSGYYSIFLVMLFGILISFFLAILR